MPNLNFAEALI